MFHTYVDFTIDGRPFYVGMGNDHRIHVMSSRNKRYGHVARKHGRRREIIQSFVERQDAIDLEIKLIAEYHTFIDDPDYNRIGCNYTKGGEGCPCSEETRQKISESKKGRSPWNKGKSGLHYNFTDEQRQKAREQLIAFNKSGRHIGMKRSDETRAKMRKPHRCSNCGELGHQKRTCKVAQKLPGFT